MVFKSKNILLNNNDKRGLSPIIATVLLVAFVIVVIVIIFIWARSVVKEPIEKFGEPIDRACDRVDWTATLDTATDMLKVTNNGEVAIYNIKINFDDNGDKVSEDLSSTDFPLTQGQSTGEIDVSSYAGSGEIISVAPILRGTQDSAEKDFTCDKNEIEFNQ
ncbi:hypothetical protein J4466_02210 [Candidatus Pacearchaeota archaeon]|nr:hypothetical protein [Candidatus Pacearchaeota archaeon]